MASSKKEFCPEAATAFRTMRLAWSCDLDSWSFSHARQDFGVAPARRRPTTRSCKDSATTAGELPAASSDDTRSDPRCLFARGESTSQTQRLVLQLPASDKFHERKAHRILHRLSYKHGSSTDGKFGWEYATSPPLPLLSRRYLTKPKHSCYQCVAQRGLHVACIRGDLALVNVRHVASTPPPWSERRSLTKPKHAC